LSVRTHLVPVFGSEAAVYPESDEAGGHVIQVDPEILSGTPVFAGTRVPVETLLEYLERGRSLAEFLTDFPTVTKEQAVAALEEVKEALLVRAPRPPQSAADLSGPRARRRFQDPRWARVLGTAETESRPGPAVQPSALSLNNIVVLDTGVLGMLGRHTAHFLPAGLAERPRRGYLLRARSRGVAPSSVQLS